MNKEQIKALEAWIDDIVASSIMRHENMHHRYEWHAVKSEEIRAEAIELLLCNEPKAQE